MGRTGEVLRQVQHSLFSWSPNFCSLIFTSLFSLITTNGPLPTLMACSYLIWLKGWPRQTINSSPPTTPGEIVGQQLIVCPGVGELFAEKKKTNKLTRRSDLVFKNLTLMLRYLWFVYRQTVSHQCQLPWLTRLNPQLFETTPMKEIV